MADVLDQTEVDALLAAVETGGVENAAQTVGVRSRHTQKEVHSYDFKRPERVSKEQMRALEGIHQNIIHLDPAFETHGVTHDAAGGILHDHIFPNGFP